MVPGMRVTLWTGYATVTGSTPTPSTTSTRGTITTENGKMDSNQVS